MDKKILMRAVFGGYIGHEPSDEVIDWVLSTLQPRERVALELRFTHPLKTYTELGKGFPRADGGIGLTRERVRQIEQKTLRKLRHPMRSRVLRGDITLSEAIDRWNEYWNEKR